MKPTIGRKMIQKMNKYSPYLAYPFMAVASVLLALIACLLSPFLALYSVIKGYDNLPGFWQWFITADDTLDGGIHQHEYSDYSGQGKFWVWFYRMCWICRNPAQGFSYHWFRAGELRFAPVFAYDFGGSEVRGISSGYYCTSVDSKGRQYFALKGKWWPCKWFGIRYSFGWKLTRTDGYHILVCALGVRGNF
ncbi:MAG: DUF7338 family protein [Saezia sp.]